MRMTVRPLRPGTAAVLAGIVLLSACQSPSDRDAARTLDAIRDGSIAAALQRHFDTHRQCATALGLGRRRLLAASADNPVAVALRDAGLIVPADEPDRWRPAPAAARWFSPSGAMPDDVAYLCYARRKVGRVLFDAENSSVSYTYRMVDFAPWTQDRALRRAVPALAAVSTGMELPGAEGLTVRDGRVRLDMVRETALDPLLFEFGMDFSRGGAIDDTGDASSHSPER